MINGKTNIYSLIGNPVSHTFSPIMHNRLFEYYKINSLYCAFEVQSSNLKSSIEGVRSLGIKGLNVTIPHKEEIISHLDIVSEEAIEIGAVNTLKNVNGIISGYNTDAYGFIKSLDVNKIDYRGKNIAVMGFGGSAKAVVYGLVNSGIKSLSIYVRNEKKVLEISKNMEVLRKISYNIKRLENINSDLESIDLLINTTPIGMGKFIDKSPVDLSLGIVNSNLAVVDLIYNPMETLLIKQSKKLGYKAINGLDMLIFQGLKSFELWTGEIPSKEIVEENIVEYISKYF